MRRHFIAIALSGPQENVLAEAERVLPKTFVMPCGLRYVFATVNDIPLENQPCGCGGKWPYQHEVVVWR